MNNKGGRIYVANVSDKVSGDVGHPVQWDSTNTQWYINTSSTNGIYSAISTGNTPDVITDVYILRRKTSRRNRDLSYKVRYVIPKEETDARSPLDSFNIQEDPLQLVIIVLEHLHQHLSPRIISLFQTVFSMVEL